MQESDLHLTFERENQNMHKLLRASVRHIQDTVGAEIDVDGG